MNRVSIIAVVLSLLFVSSTRSFDSHIDWQGQPWEVTLVPNEVDGKGAAARGFGKEVGQIIHYGQILGTEADVALARAEAIVLDANSKASAKVEFQRSFVLSGSPAGWAVTLEGLISGDLLLNDPNNIGFARVLAKADLLDDGGIVVLSLRVSEQREDDGGTGFFDPLSDTAVLDNGTYQIKGSLDATAVATIGQPPVMASSRFFFGGWAVGIEATAIPEPSTLLGLGSGLVMLAGIGRNRLFTRRESSGFDR